jgi:hypothetical protein
VVGVGEPIGASLRRGDDRALAQPQRCLLGAEEGKDIRDRLPSLQIADGMAAAVARYER